MSSRRPVVTGLGILTAAGCGCPRCGTLLRAGRSGLGPLTLFASPRYGRHQVGQVREDVDQLAGDVRGSRSDKLAWIAAREAIQQSGLAMPLNGHGADRAGVLLGSTVAGMLGTEEVVGRMLRENPQSAIRNPQLFGTEEVPGDLLRRQPAASPRCATTNARPPRTSARGSWARAGRRRHSPPPAPPARWPSPLPPG